MPSFYATVPGASNLCSSLNLIGPVTGSWPDQDGLPQNTTIYDQLIRADTDGNVGTVQQIQAGGFSALRYADNNGYECSALGYGNFGATSVFEGFAFWETLSFNHSAFTPRRIINTIAGAGSPYAQQIMAEWSADGSVHFYEATAITSCNQRLSFDGTGTTVHGPLKGDGANFGSSSGTAVVNAGNVVNSLDSFHGEAGAGYNVYFAGTNSTSGSFVGAYFNGIRIGSMVPSGTMGVSFLTASDVRHKKNISDVGDTGHLIDRLKVRKWDWKIDDSHESFGFVAQEISEVIPGAVWDGGKSGLFRDDTKLIPLLVKEIQSLRARLAAAKIQ